MLGGSSTNDKGEYRMHGLPPSRYYVYVRCEAELSAPHTLMARDDPAKPRQVYAPAFYPGVREPAAATRVAVAPGAEVRSIDVQVRRAATVTIRGRIGATDPAVLAGQIDVNLFPRTSGLADWIPTSGRFDSRTKTFRVDSVLPGSYLLIASTAFNGSLHQARAPIDIGNTPPDPIDLTLTPGADVSGTLEIEGGDGGSRPEDQAPQVALLPIDVPGGASSPQAAVDKDGTFSLHGVVPGRWSLRVFNTRGAYVKSFSIGDQEAAPWSFDLAEGAGPWRIVMGSKPGRLQLSCSGAVSREARISAVLMPAAPEQFAAGFQRDFQFSSDGRVSAGGITPGRYRVFAVEAGNAWELANRPELLKTLESRSELVEIREGEEVKVSLDVIHADEMKRLLQEAE